MNYDARKGDLMSKIKIRQPRKDDRPICCKKRMVRLYIASNGFFAIDRVICKNCGKIKERSI